MQPNLKTPLVEYHYDALNRLVASTPSVQATAQRFYQKNKLITEVQGALKRSIMRSDSQPLAQQQRQGSATVETSLLAADLQGSVLNVLDATQSHPLAYTPYGHRPLGNGLLSLLGFSGERPDPVTGCYLLGTGHHRPFNPVLMRFICPDSWSPFGVGGLNAYGYCAGDPVNRMDPTGHWRTPILIKKRLRTIGLMSKPNTPVANGTPSVTVDISTGAIPKTGAMTRSGITLPPKSLDFQTSLPLDIPTTTTTNVSMPPDPPPYSRGAYSGQLPEPPKAPPPKYVDPPTFDQSQQQHLKRLARKWKRPRENPPSYFDSPHPNRVMDDIRDTVTFTPQEQARNRALLMRGQFRAPG
jgi:RHS repeat-associated protein